MPISLVSPDPATAFQGQGTEQLVLSGLGTTARYANGKEEHHPTRVIQAKEAPKQEALLINFCLQASLCLLTNLSIGA